MRELIKAKEEQRPPREIEEAAPVSNVINLMDALKRSVGKGGDGKPAGKGGESKSSASAGKAKTPASKPQNHQEQKRQDCEQDRQEGQPPQGCVMDS